ncbi:hypothetical protein Y032_0060g3177 [Ancylostoma ceylanicum]|uniref:Uncharacterized protein n=1 Tax=Ancylostoma ceylanicum TaxID=53326 RepID=A0A016U3N9_9BILA|nr:hypothetical protein Y032_0060g3177 [Ancylostoma ceylanicum]
MGTFRLPPLRHYDTHPKIGECAHTSHRLRWSDWDLRIKCFIGSCSCNGTGMLYVLQGGATAFSEWQ